MAASGLLSLSAASCTLTVQAEQYGIALGPAEDNMVPIGNGINLLIIESRQGEGDKQRVVRSFTLQCNEADGNQRIDAFIAAAFQYYKEVKRGKKDTNR